MTPGIYAQELSRRDLQTSEYYKVTHVITHKIAKIIVTFPTFVAYFMTRKKVYNQMKNYLLRQNCKTRLSLDFKHVPSRSDEP